MKKISIFLLAALAMISCGNSYKAHEVNLANETDSVNHAVGLLHGLQIKMYYLAKDSSDEAVAEFIDALEAAYLNQEEDLNEFAKTGNQLGTAVKGFENRGLADNPTWTLNEKMFFQGFVNGVFEDTTVMDPAIAEAYLMQSYQAYTPGAKAGKPILGKCPKTVKVVELTNKDDSIN